MTSRFLIASFTVMLLIQGVAGQPSFIGPVPDGSVVEDADLRRSQYLNRVNEVIDWHIASAGWGKPTTETCAAEIAGLRSTTPKELRSQLQGDLHSI